MRKRLRRLTFAFLNLRYVLLLSSILFFVIIGTAILLVYQNTGVMREQIDADFNQQQLALARQTAYQIEESLHEFENTLENLAQLLSRIPQTDWEEVLQSTVERSRARGLTDIGIVDTEGKTRVSYGPESQSSRLATDILANCRKGDDEEMVLGPVHVIEDSPGVPAVSAVLCYDMPGRSMSGNILYVRLDVSGLIGFVASHIRSGNTGYAWTLNEEGVFLYHPEEEFIGRNAFTVRKERKPKISFKQINRIMKDQMLRGEEGTGTYVSGWHRGIEGDINKLIAFAPVKCSLLAPEHVWSVAVTAPISEVAEPVRRLYKRNLAAEAALLVSMFVFGLLVAIYQNRMSQTLRKRVKETEADLHEVERIYQRMVEQATDLIYIFDLEMRFVILNQQTVDVFVALLKRDDDLVIPDGAYDAKGEFWKGRRLDKLVHPPDASFVRKKIDQVLEKNHSISYEHTIKAKDRQIRLSTKLIPIRDDKGRVHYILGISRDMTEKMEMDHRIYSAEKLASIGILASGVAHEINNPLAIILGFTDLLLERLPEESQEYEDLKLIEQNANHAKKVVQDLLGFARITEGLESTVSVKKSVGIVTQLAENTLMTQKIKLISDIPDDLPKFRGDAREFQQVIFNLINNAVAAMSANDSREGELTLTAKADQDWVHVSVGDNGLGIPNRIKEQIFDPFFTTKKAGEGTGLGLSLCYGIVTKYGGKISFSSSSAEDYPDRPTGTKFVVSMPVSRTDKD